MLIAVEARYNILFDLRVMHTVGCVGALQDKTRPFSHYCPVNLQDQTCLMAFTAGRFRFAIMVLLFVAHDLWLSSERTRAKHLPCSCNCSTNSHLRVGSGVRGFQLSEPLNLELRNFQASKIRLIGADKTDHRLTTRLDAFSGGGRKDRGSDWRCRRIGISRPQRRVRARPSWCGWWRGRPTSPDGREKHPRR